MKRALITFSAALLAYAAVAMPTRSGAEGAPAAAPTAEALLQLSDRGRGALTGGITWTIESRSVEDGEADDRSFVVKSRGADALVEALTPARNKGEVFLFNDRALWFVRPGLRKPVSISPRQKLSGTISNGDLASTNYARDYTGTIVGEENVGNEPCYVLNLKARVDNVTYDRIRYWVSKSKNLGMKAEFRTVSDVVFKTATFEYQNKVKIDGKDYDMVSRMLIADPRSKSTATLRFVNPKVESHSPSMFNINNVLR